MSGSIAPKAPNGGNTVFAFVAIGCGLPPTMAYGSSNDRRRDERAVAPRRRRGVDVHVVAAREVVGQPVGRADGEAAVAGDVPRDADARRQVRPLLVVAGLAVGEAGVARIEKPGGRVEEHRALHAAAEVVVVEVGRAAVEHLLAEERLPAQAGVERHAARRSATRPARTARCRSCP